MKNLNKRDPLDLRQTRDRKQAKVAQLREAIAQAETPANVAALWERTILALEADIEEIDQHLAKEAK